MRRCNITRRNGDLAKFEPQLDTNLHFVYLNVIFIASSAVEN